MISFLAQKCHCVIRLLALRRISVILAVGFLGDFDDLFEASSEFLDDHGLAVDLGRALSFGLLRLGQQTLTGGLDNLGCHETERLSEK